MGVVRRRIALGFIAVALTAGCASTPHRVAAPPTTVPPTTSTFVPVTDGATSTSTSTVTVTVAPVTGCKDEGPPPALDAQLVQANGTPGGQTVSGSVYYGICDTTAYAVARFRPSAAATPQEANSFQDAGAAPHYFIQAAGQPWRLVGSAPFPGHQNDCSTFTQAPNELRAAWQDCPDG